MSAKRLWLCVLKIAHRLTRSSPVFYENLKKQRNDFCKNSFVNLRQKKEQVKQTAIFWAAFYETEPLILMLEDKDVLKAANRIGIREQRVRDLMSKRLA
mgnify:CR=1 FL=1